MAYIEINNLHKYYRMGDTVIKALDGVDLSIEKGEVICLLGPPDLESRRCSTPSPGWKNPLRAKSTSVALRSRPYQNKPSPGFAL